MKSIYVIGSLRNPEIPKVGNLLRGIGLGVFDDWFSAGPRADDHWKEYEQGRGNSFKEALDGFACRHVFAFDRFHLDRTDASLLVLPAGKSGHLELGYSIGSGKRGFILADPNTDLDRWDVMIRFAERYFTSVEEMMEFFKNDQGI